MFYICTFDSELAHLMTMTTSRGKTIRPNQITGEYGAALVKVRTHAMGFLYSPYGPVEAGIDGIIELRDRLTGEVGGRLVAVQVKTTDDERYTAETEDTFDYLCKPDDIAYWQQANVPVIIVLVRRSDDSAYWKLVRTPGAPITDRRLRIDKKADRFDASAADAIAAVTIDQAEPGTWLPASAKPDNLLFNAVKVVLPPMIQVAATPHRAGRDVLRALLDINDHPPGAWVARGGRLLTFLDIETTLLHEAVDDGTIECLQVDEFSLTDDEDERRLFVELLNRTLRYQLDPALAWSRTLKLYYYPASMPGIDRTLRYQSLKNETSRGVVTAKRRPDGSVSYVRHSAFAARFWPAFEEWYLTIEPAYVFTRDGVRPDGYAGERISKLKRRENNAALRGQFAMWRSVLTGLGKPKDQADLLSLDDQGPSPVLRFEALDMVELPVSVPDEIWRSKDSFKPQTDDEELPL
jgi:hypothetical protein